MAGTNYYTQISPSTWVAFTEDTEVVNGIQLAMVAKCTGTPKTAADGVLYVNLFEHGCIMTQIDTGSGNPAVFENTGTRAVPVWTLLSTSGGATGPTGYTGYTGFTGTTGFTGPAGVGSAAYGYAVGQSDTVIGADSDVTFDLNSNTLPNAGFTTVPNASTSFTVLSTGAYEFDFYVSGLPSTNVPLEFALYINGAVSAFPQTTEFRSQTTASATDKLNVIGHGFVQLTAGDVVTLHNRTNTVTDTVTVTSVPLGGEAGANRTLSLKKIN